MLPFVSSKRGQDLGIPNLVPGQAKHFHAVDYCGVQTKIWGIITRKRRSLSMAPVQKCNMLLHGTEGGVLSLHMNEIRLELHEC